MYKPIDNEKYRALYESQSMGVCGLSVLAVLKETTITDILEIWEKEIGEYPGFSTMKNMRKMLTILGYKTKLKSGKKATGFIYYPGKRHILRIQWEGTEDGKFHGYSNWHDATCNTHWILVDEDSVYCNAHGWFSLNWLVEYLEGDSAQKRGYITSYLEVDC